MDILRENNYKLWQVAWSWTFDGFCNLLENHIDLLTGGFGILGLLKDFKNKDTGKITRWGLVSLLGILVSMVLGATAQIKEWTGQERSRTHTAEQTLQLLRNTDESVHEIGRLLAPLENPQVQVILIARCDQFGSFCKRIASDGNPSRGELMYFPGSRLDLDIDFFRNEQDAENYLLQGAQPHARPKPDLSIWVKAILKDEDSLRVIKAYGVDEVWITLGSKAITSVSGNNRIRSTRDLAGSTMLLTGFWSPSKWSDAPPQFIDMKVKWFDMTVQSGEPIDLDMKQFQERVVRDDPYGRPFTVFLYSFPKPT